MVAEVLKLEIIKETNVKKKNAKIEPRDAFTLEAEGMKRSNQKSLDGRKIRNVWSPEKPHEECHQGRE